MRSFFFFAEHKTRYEDVGQNFHYHQLSL